MTRPGQWAKQNGQGLAGMANEKELPCVKKVPCVNMRANSWPRVLNTDGTAYRPPKMAECGRNAAWSEYG